MAGRVGTVAAAAAALPLSPHTRSPPPLHVRQGEVKPCRAVAVGEGEDNGGVSSAFGPPQLRPPSCTHDT